MITLLQVRILHKRIQHDGIENSLLAGAPKSGAKQDDFIANCRRQPTVVVLMGRLKGLARHLKSARTKAALNQARGEKMKRRSFEGVQPDSPIVATATVGNGERMRTATTWYDEDDDVTPPLSRRRRSSSTSVASPVIAALEEKHRIASAWREARARGEKLAPFARR